MKKFREFMQEAISPKRLAHLKAEKKRKAEMVPTKKPKVKVGTPPKKGK